MENKKIKGTLVILASLALLWLIIYKERENLNPFLLFGIGMMVVLLMGLGYITFFLKKKDPQ